MEKPNLYKYLDYRVYLRDFYHYKKQQNAAYSLAVFARKAQFGVRNYLKRVMDGERPISSENLPKFCLGLELDAKEALYFESLVAFNQAKNSLSQNHYFLQLQKNLAKAKQNSTQELDIEYFDIFSQWYVIPLLEYLDINKNVDIENLDYTQINKDFHIKLSAKEIKDSYQLLLKVGLAKINENGMLAKTFKETRFSKNFQNILIRNYHVQMLEIAKTYVLDADLSTRSLKALSLSLNQEEYIEVQQRIDQFFKELNQEFTGRESSKDQLVQINLQSLKITKNRGKT